MTDMQEKVARAIAGICNDKGQELASKCEMQAPPISWQAFEREAKAAIEAYEKTLKAQGLVIVPREPSEGSIANGVQFLIDANLDGPDGVGQSDARGCWQAMIDAVLEGE